MSTPSNERPSGRDKLAEMRAAEARSGQQKKLLGIVAAFVAVVLAVVGVMWVISSNSSSSGGSAATPNAAAIHKMETVSDSTFDKVGAGKSMNPPTKLAGAPALTDNGKPRVIFYGGEFCPWCAMARWSMVSALSRFGTWSGLTGTVSSEGNIPTVDFVKAHYTSPYLSLTPYEILDQNHNTLQTPSAADNALMTKYDTPTYFSGVQGAGGIPFIIYGGQHASTGGINDAASTMQNAKGNKVADALNDPSDTNTQALVGGANVISAQICAIDGNKPANVCNSAGVKAAASQLTK